MFSDPLNYLQGIIIYFIFRKRKKKRITICLGQAILIYSLIGTKSVQDNIQRLHSAYFRPRMTSLAPGTRLYASLYVGNRVG